MQSCSNFEPIGDIRLYRTAKWRSSPASDAQKSLVQKRWAKALLTLTDVQKEEFLTKLTKGKAAALITRIKHGAVVGLSMRYSGLRGLSLTYRTLGTIPEKREGTKKANRCVGEGRIACCSRRNQSWTSFINLICR